MIFPVVILQSGNVVVRKGKVNDMMNIKVLGGGCSKCEALLGNAKEAVGNLGVEADVEYITDFSVIAGYGIMSTPALMVDEKVVSTGKVLKAKEIEGFLK